MNEMSLLYEWGQCCPSHTWFSPLKMTIHVGQGLTQKEFAEQLLEGGWGPLIGRTNLNRAAKDDGAGVLRKLASEKAELAEGKPWG